MLTFGSLMRLRRSRERGKRQLKNKRPFRNDKRYLIGRKILEIHPNRPNRMLGRKSNKCSKTSGNEKRNKSENEIAKCSL